MKKILIGGLVAGLLLFVWQTLSYTVLNLHAKAFRYTALQDSIIHQLGSQLPGEGQYLLPTLPPEASAADREALMTSAEGKPWAIVSYHSALSINMGTNIVRGAIVNIVLMMLFCWILSLFGQAGFGQVFIASIFTGLIQFMNGAYTQHIWYHSFDLMAHLTDAIVGWGLAGIWLGWWWSRGRQ